MTKITYKKNITSMQIEWENKYSLTIKKEYAIEYRS